MNNTEPLTPLSMAILLALLEGPQHGYGLMQEIEAQTGRRPGTGTLYAALDRLETENHIVECEVESAEDARRRYFRITPGGMAAARAESARMLGVLDRARARSVFTSFSTLRESS
jgi:DNA-binding PadR family transcriptional regulator